MPALMQIRLAKACRRRKKGAPMTVTQRAAYMMMQRGEAVVDQRFMVDFERAHGIRPKTAPPAAPPVPEPAKDLPAEPTPDSEPPAKKKTKRGPGRPRKEN
jgi:hypothetical protein